MCEPISAGIATAIGAAASLYGTMQSAKAATANQQAIAAQNRATQVAQNEGFTQRLNAGLAQTGAQTAASQETLAARSSAADQMRQQQTASLQNYQDAVNAQNEQAQSLRQTGDTAAQQLLQRTSASNLADAQTRRQQEAEALVNNSLAQQGPQTSAPSGDPVAGGALARRTAEAATNIRNYGSKIAAVGAYNAPAQQIGLNIADTAYGIMPAQTAENLLRSGSSTRLLPTKTAYQAATGLGQAQDTLLQSRGQSALDAAGLSYGNATDIANLQQSNATTTAGNTARQAQANAEAMASQGQMISGIGKLGLYGAGYFGGLGTPNAAPGWEAGANGIFTNIATGATTDLPGVTMPDAGRSGGLSGLFGLIR